MENTHLSIRNLCALAHEWGVAVTCRHNDSATTCTIKTEGKIGETAINFTVTSRGDGNRDAQTHAAKQVVDAIESRKRSPEGTNHIKTAHQRVPVEAQSATFQAAGFIPA